MSITTEAIHPAPEQILIRAGAGWIIRPPTGQNRQFTYFRMLPELRIQA